MPIAKHIIGTDNPVIVIETSYPIPDSRRRLVFPVASVGKLTSGISSRVETLQQIGISNQVTTAPVAAVLFTGAAFGPAVSKVRRSFVVSIFTLHETAFKLTIQVGNRIALVIPFSPSVPLRNQLGTLMIAAGNSYKLTVIIVPDDLNALRTGDT